MSAVTVSAQTNPTTEQQCIDQGGTVNVGWVGIESGRSITVTASWWTERYTGTGSVRVFCTTPGVGFGQPGYDLGDIVDATVLVQAFDLAGGPVATFQVIDPASGQPVDGPVRIGPFTGTTTFTIVSDTDNLALAAQPVGWNIQVVAAVGNTSFSAPGFGPGLGAYGPSAGGPVLAKTPELGSLALFGTGLAGMGSYALARYRAGRSRAGAKRPES
jgi:hypothetical protein